MQRTSHIPLTHELSLLNWHSHWPDFPGYEKANLDSFVLSRREEPLVASAGLRTKKRSLWSDRKADASLPAPVYANFDAFMKNYANHDWSREGTLLILSRHGPSLFNRVNTVNGADNSPLLHEGVVQTEDLAKTLAPLALDGILSSPLQRAHLTAEILKQHLGLTTPVISEARLEETKRGILSARPKNMTSAQIDEWFKLFDDAQYRQEFRSRFDLSEAEMQTVFDECRKARAALQAEAAHAGLSEDDYVEWVTACEQTLECAPPRGESFRQGEARAKDLAGDLNEWRKGAYLLMGHGMQHRFLMMQLLGVPVQSVEQLYSIPQTYCCINVLWKKKGQDQWTLLVFNSDRYGQ